MAQNKKSFVLYSDSQGLVNQLPDDVAGRLLKHIFAYVNDEEPKTDELLVNIAFEPIKMQLKRDLIKWDETKEVRSKAGLASAEARRLKKENQQNSTNSTSVDFVENNLTKSTVSVNVNDNVNVTTIEKENSAIVVEYPDIDFEPIKTTIELKNEYKSNPILSIAPIITIEAFLNDCMQDKMWVESIIRPNKLTEEKMILALKDYQLSCNGLKKIEPQTMNLWKRHFFNWINYVLRESRK
jgi:hypothetical protein